MGRRQEESVLKLFARTASLPKSLLLPAATKKPATDQSPRLSTIRDLSIVGLILGGLVVGAWLTTKAAVEYVLSQNARLVTLDLVRYVKDNIPDLDQIAAGQLPSGTSLGIFQLNGTSGQVFRYAIFSPEGHLKLIADRGQVTIGALPEANVDAARAMTTDATIAYAKEGNYAGLPPFYVESYAPVILDGRPTAVIAAYIDETTQRATITYAAMVTLPVVCSITGLAFMIPAIAWYRRTKEKRQADERIRFLAHHDMLTGLANRAQLVEKLESALAVLPLRKDKLAIHFVDLDKFKEVNDFLGHDGGDFLLRTVAERMRGVVRTGDIVARLGGDEFVVVQTGIRERTQAEDFAQRLAAAVVVPITFKEQEIITTVSIGGALAPDDGTESGRLLKSADLALYRSKADGRNCIRFFEPAMDGALQARMTLEKTVRNAIQHKRFVLHYQPLFEVSGENLIGFEALVRMVAEDGTLISPAAFIPVAEELRLIERIGAWVLHEACRTAVQWPEPLTIAVNLSPAQFESGNVCVNVRDALAESGLAPGRLELEITETLLLGSDRAVMAELQALKAMGVKIVMDDFGTGYSSLSYLWRFPFDKIKIDRSFMQAFDAPGRDAETVVKTIIRLGRELNMRVTVEGVETSKQAAFLNSADADQVQGFFFGRPMPESEIGAEILKNFRKSLPAPSASASRASGPRTLKSGDRLA